LSRCHCRGKNKVKYAAMTNDGEGKRFGEFQSHSKRRPKAYTKWQLSPRRKESRGGGDENTSKHMRESRMSILILFPAKSGKNFVLNRS